MKNIKFLPLAFAAMSIFAFSCEPTEDLAGEDIQGTWYISWVKDFALDPIDTNAIKALCNPGTEARINIAGLAETKFQGRPSGHFENNTYIKLYDMNISGQTNSNTLVHTNHYISPNDIAISSIDHRDIYVTGQEGHIRKKNTTDGTLVLESYRERVRPKFTVFVDLIGEQTRVRTRSDGSTYTESDRNNRLGGITVDCERSSGPAIENVYRMANAPIKIDGDRSDSNVLTSLADKYKASPSIDDLAKKSQIFGGNRAVLDAHKKELKTRKNKFDID